MIRLFKRMNYKHVAASIFFMFVQIMSTLALPTLTANMIDNGVAVGNIDYIWKIGIGMLIVTVISIGGAFLNVHFAAVESQGLGDQLRREIYNKVMHLSNEELDGIGTSTLITRTTNDVMQIQMVSMMILRSMIMAPIMIFGAGFLAYQREPQLAFVFLISVPLLAIVLGTILKLVNPLFKKLQTQTDNLNRIFREGLTGIRVIRAFNRSEYEEERFDEANNDFSSTSKRAMSLLSLNFPMLTIIASLTNILILWFGAQLIDADQMQIGNLVAFLTYAGQILIGVMNLAFVAFFLPRGQVSAQRINEVLDIEKTIVNPVDSKIEQQTTDISLAFEEVNFRYTGAEKLALKDINFHMKAGETLAIIGGTGSGKTSIANLIPRFYDVESGSVKINGVDVREITQEELRKEIGFAPQKALLFSGTIRENMQYGNPGATDEEIWHALEIAQGKEFVSELPKQLGHWVEQGGGNFSGGQRQRLSIARALVTKANIFIFDDSFSALDFKTDTKLRRALKPETTESIVVLIAQRISTVLDADLILVLDNGRIVGKGTHQELKESNEVYQEIMNSQLKGEEI